MKKKIIAFGMMLALLLSLSTIAYGAEETPTVTFDGSEDIKYNYDDTDNFGTKFNDMQPGEERVQEILLKNTSNKSIDFFMRTEVLKAFEDAKKASEAAYQISLTITQDGKTETIYGGNESDGTARIGADENGLKDMNVSLQEWLMLVNLKPSKTATLKMTVFLDGESHTNDYQAADGTFQFEFRAGYDDAPPQTEIVTEKQADKIVTNKVTTPGPVNKVVRQVKTGDDTPVGFWLMAAGASLLIVILAAVYGKKKKEKHDHFAAK